MKRSELYSAVWARPISVLAAGWTTSDTWVRKVCAKHNVPVPPRGYWQRLEAGQKPDVLPLPVGLDVEIALRSAPMPVRDGRPAIQNPEPRPAKAKARASAVTGKPVDAGELALPLALFDRAANQWLRHQAWEAMLLEFSAEVATMRPRSAPSRKFVAELRKQVDLRRVSVKESLRLMVTHLITSSSSSVTQVNQDLR